MLPPVARRLGAPTTRSLLIPNQSSLVLRPKLETGPRENHVQHAKRSWVKCGWIGWHWGPPVVHRSFSTLAEKQNGPAIESPPCLHRTNDVRNTCFGFQDHRQRSGPKASTSGESLRDGGGQLVDLVLVVNVKNQRVVGGPTLEAVDLRYRIDIECGRTNPYTVSVGTHNSSGAEIINRSQDV